MANEDKATRYHRLRRRAALAGVAGGTLFLLVLVASGASAGLRGFLTSLTGGASYGTVALYVVVLMLVYELFALPLAFYEGVTLERRYQLSTQTTAAWWADHAKAWAVSAAFVLFAAAVVWTLIDWSPEWWWLAAGGVFVLALVVLAQLAPVVLLPLFYEIRPLDRPALASRLIALAERAQTPVLGVFEWRLSTRTRKANAALAGLGRTRRILLSDTLLAEHSDDEIEVILAHELAHHVHHDIRSSLLFESVLLLGGLYVADAVLTAFSGSFGLSGKSDIAALPLLVLAAGAISLALMPVANTISRRHERRADRYALAITGNVEAFMSAMKRLAAQNLAEERPSRVVELLLHSHPSTAERVAAARAWALERARAP